MRYSLIDLSHSNTVENFVFQICRRLPRLIFRTLRVDPFGSVFRLSERESKIHRETKYSCDHFEAAREDCHVDDTVGAHRDDSGREVRVSREAGGAAHVSHNSSRAANGSLKERATTPCVCSSQRCQLQAFCRPKEIDQIRWWRCVSGLLVRAAHLCNEQQIPALT